MADILDIGGRNGLDSRPMTGVGISNVKTLVLLIDNKLGN